jgi:hypothetical protein
MKPVVYYGIAGGVVVILVALASLFTSSPEKEPASIPAAKAAEAKKTSLTNPSLFDWRILKQYNVKTGDMPNELRDLNNEFIRVPGFVVPLEDNQSRVTEFLLVPSQMTCAHVPPPPPNFIFYVTSKNKSGFETPWGPVWLTGQLSVGKGTLADRGEYYLKVDAVKLEPYRAEGN